MQSPRSLIARMFGCAAAAVIALGVPSDSAEAATAPIDTRGDKSLAAGPSLAEGVAAMKRGADYLAFAMLEPYARHGYRVAEANLASLYLHGRGTAKDPVTARFLFEHAAAQGLGLAFGQLGAMHQRGLGTPADPQRALEWYRRGAAAGDPASLFGLALHYQNGAGVAASLREAAKWYRMAALRGHAKAQFMLAVMLYQGRGMAQDLVEAYQWFALAQGALPPGPDRERSAKAARLIEARLPPDLLEAARGAVASWQPPEARF